MWKSMREVKCNTNVGTKEHNTYGRRFPCLIVQSQVLCANWCYISKPFIRHSVLICYVQF